MKKRFSIRTVLSLILSVSLLLTGSFSVLGSDLIITDEEFFSKESTLQMADPSVSFSENEDLLISDEFSDYGEDVYNEDHSADAGVSDDLLLIGDDPEEGVDPLQKESADRETSLPGAAAVDDSAVYDPVSMAADGFFEINDLQGNTSSVTDQTDVTADKTGAAAPNSNETADEEIFEESETESETESAEETKSESESETETRPEAETETQTETELSDEHEDSKSSEDGVLSQTVTGTMEYDDPTIAPSLSVPSGNGLRRAALNASAGAVQTASFTCFGDQLDEPSRILYDQRVKYYVTNGKTGSFQIGCTRTTAFCIFPVDVKKETKNGTVQTVIDTSSASYKAGIQSFLKMMQASADAFYYDYPELFWYRPGSFSYEVDAWQDGSSWKAYIKKVNSAPSTAYPGAASQLALFAEGVEQTVSRIESSSDYNLDGTVSVIEKIQGAHDYLCGRLWYDRDTLNSIIEKQNAGTTIKDYHIYSAAGAFIDDVSIGTGVVCEGYAKAFAVLLHKMNIPCVLVAGLTSGSSIGHMWNAVKYEGTWYLVDPTWDDKGDLHSASYSYYMTHSQASGRTPSGYLSGASGYTASGFYLEKQQFLYPVITTASQSFTRTNIQEEACTGYQEYQCSGSPVIFWKWVSEPLGHQEETYLGDESTCITKGFTEMISCSRCGKVLVPSRELPLGDHSFNSQGQCIHCGKWKLEKAAVSVSAQTYTGKALKPQLTVKLGGKTLTPGTDYTVSSWTNNTNAGTASVLLKGSGNYIGTKKATFTIGRRNVASAKASVANAVYNGKAQKPAVTVKWSGMTLHAGTDYTLTWTGNVKIGTAKVKITGKGNYQGSKTLSFKILPSKMITTKVSSSGKKLIVTWKKRAGSSGFQLQYSVNKNMSGAKTITLPASATSRRISGLKAGKRYYVRMRIFYTVNGIRYYSAWPAVKSAVIK